MVLREDHRGKAGTDYRERLVELVRRRPRALNLPFSIWTAARLADHLAEETGLRMSVASIHRLLHAAGLGFGRPQRTISSPDPDYAVKKVVERARDDLKPGSAFYYADEFAISWHPTLRPMWRPKAQQVMIPTPMQPTRRYGLGAVNWHSGETVVLTRHHKISVPAGRCSGAASFRRRPRP
ncbi:hypothetical protein OPKNFCMD_0526 [Methylobacterium crusticola]|uniref:Winged helix-turn helix domain-containing protein n=1 Tax=Methylobacterium crusticola TaxID=1697972 RepID=A0ABQ4QSR0_9HYPH|nr:winged helix-turn-helix domain-containing protein [Methylobacterium crusticola]GJD47815.1 hypothetical protein OPKNFCMD_0526 [Methylobacterium crusticola]